MFNRLGRSLVAWLAASSLLVSSSAAVVHTHEHPGHEHANGKAHAKPAHSHTVCRHHHHHAEPASKSKNPQPPTLPHSHDDCSLCHFLLEHPLPPSIVEMPLLDAVVEMRAELPCLVAASGRSRLPAARGPPCPV